MRILWLHGLEGSPTGHKATELRRLGFDLVAPDGRGLPLAQRVALAEAALEVDPDRVLVGSSYGGLAAAAIASRRPLAGLLLLAPALHHSEPPVEDPGALRILESTPTLVLHGRADAVVPIEVSRALAGRCPHVELRELDDGHALANSLEAIAAAARELGLGALRRRIDEAEKGWASVTGILDHLLDPDPEAVAAATEAAIRWLPRGRLPRVETLLAVARSHAPALQPYREALCDRWKTAGIVFAAVARSADARDRPLEDRARETLGLTRTGRGCDVCRRIPQGRLEVASDDDLPHAVAALLPAGVLGTGSERTCPLCGAGYALDELTEWDEGFPASRLLLTCAQPED